MVEITADEQEKRKKREKKKKKWDCLRDLWGNIKQTNIHIIGILEEKRERERA